MPNFQVTTEIRYPLRSGRVAHGFRRWAILNGMRQALLALEFRDDAGRSPNGIDERCCVFYRDHFTDDRRHLAYSSDDGEIAHISIDHGAYALCEVAADLRTGFLHLVDDQRLSVAVDPSGLRGIARAFVDELEFQERGAGKTNAVDFPWRNVRLRIKVKELWSPGRELLLMGEDGDAFVKQASAPAVVVLARAIANDLREASDWRERPMRSLLAALDSAAAASSTPPPAVLVTTEEMVAAELLVDQLRLRQTLPSQSFCICRACGHETAPRLLDSNRARRSRRAASTVTAMGPLWPSIYPGGAAMRRIGGVGGAGRGTCPQCDGSASSTRRRWLCPKCSSDLPEGLIEICRGCHTPLVATDTKRYWFSPPTRTSGTRSEPQPGAGPRDAVPR